MNKIFKNFSKRDRDRIISLIIVIIVSVFGFIYTLYEDYRNEKRKESVLENDFCTVHYLDVGQGDCTLIETFDGKFALIDTSTRDASTKIIDYLTDEGVQELEFLILTHPHEDHIGSASEVLKKFPVKTIYMNSKTETTSSYHKLIKQIKRCKEDFGTKVIMPESNDTFRLSDIVFTIISDGEKYESLNNSSICVKLELGESSFLFTGDIEAEVEYSLLNSGIDIDCDVFKSAHHGSSTSNTEAFMEAASPEICVVSCGLNNDYGHPHREVVSYLADNNIRLLRTDIDGDIRIVFNRETISVM